MKINTFEEIRSWQKARDLVRLIYKLFKDSKDYSFRDQIQRASISIMNNVAEGFERRGDKELSHFLFIAKGSSAEVKSMSYLALDLGCISKKEFETISILTTEISRLLSAFIKTL
ncbi:four helix bundle protein [Candidatus Woesebacteria bacterium]|jgi:four helix bundle protein|nr:four helix bundle protein [Candidatus Woesebacteria bacterium]